jgi:hypothetical protein
MTERDAQMMLADRLEAECVVRENHPDDYCPDLTKMFRECVVALRATAAAPVAVEVWNGERKVTVYDDIVLRVWGPNMEDEMSEEPRSHETVGAAFKWLFDAAAPVAGIGKLRCEMRADSKWKKSCPECDGTGYYTPDAQAPSDLAAEWQAEARKHTAAALEDDAEVGGDEWELAKQP